MSDPLHADHHELRHRMRGFAALMEGDPAAVVPALLRARVAFSATYHRHRRDEAKVAAAAAAVHPTLTPMADRLAAGDRALDADYSAHVRRWTPARIVAEWRGYRDDVLALQRRLIDRLTWEERNAFPPLAIQG